MTTSVIGTDKWSGYRQARYIRLIERITGKPCVEFAVVEGNLSYQNERVLRGRIEKLSGKKFVFGFDPTDKSMLAGDHSTYSWFLSDLPVVMEWVTEVSDELVDCECDHENGGWHTHEVTKTTDPFGFEMDEWVCEFTDGEFASIQTGYTREGSL